MLVYCLLNLHFSCVSSVQQYNIQPEVKPTKPITREVELIERSIFSLFCTHTKKGYRKCMGCGDFIFFSFFCMRHRDFVFFFFPFLCVYGKTRKKTKSPGRRQHVVSH
jgi:hypothetical protein